jgi:hypothetical protein
MFAASRATLFRRTSGRSADSSGCSAKFRTARVVVHGFTFTSFQNNASGKACIRVSRDGELVFERTGNNDDTFTIGQLAYQENGIVAIPAGTDITGRGHANVIVSHYTGGAHCCRLDYIFELEPRFKLLATLDSQDDDTAHFVQLDDTGQWYYDTTDWTFGYWFGSFAGSPVHEVLLAYSDGNKGKGYHLALDKMQKPAPDAAEWDALIASIRTETDEKRRDFAADLRGALWQNVLDLLYTGHPELAWKLVREAGPQAQGGSYPTLEDFCSTLTRSLYWRDLRPMMKDAPAACKTAPNW